MTAPDPEPDPFADGIAFLDIYGLGDHLPYRVRVADVARYGWASRYVVGVARALVRLDARRRRTSEGGEGSRE